MPETSIYKVSDPRHAEYFLPNDEKERDRLNLQHDIALLIHTGALSVAPVQSPARVLDVGTGTGIRVIEFALQNPSSSVLGTDLSPIQPPFVPPSGCRWELRRHRYAEVEWAYARRRQKDRPRPPIPPAPQRPPRGSGVYKRNRDEDADPHQPVAEGEEAEGPGGEGDAEPARDRARYHHGHVYQGARVEGRRCGEVVGGGE